MQIRFKKISIFGITNLELDKTTPDKKFKKLEEKIFPKFRQFPRAMG